jgi:hypothetical protein
MYKKLQVAILTAAFIVLPADGTAAAPGKALDAVIGNSSSGLWRNPGDISTRNLFYGPGGQEHEPHGPFTFLKEDLEGTNPKFEVRDRDGVKWKVKLGEEVRPETAASRLVWAVGYFTNEDYFLPTFRAENMPHRLHRGQNLVSRDGSMRNVRLKRSLKGEKKLGVWKWRRDPFSGTRELNGLRVMMALINNWDLKDVNNAIFEEKEAGELEGKQIYVVTDLGASFGTTGRSWTRAESKGNLKAYSRSKFIRKVTPSYVDFNVPSRPALIHFFELPEFVSRLQLRWIGKHIPREDATWMGQVLARLSPDQIRDAFRASGYSAHDVDAFSHVVELRIAELNKL